MCSKKKHYVTSERVGEIQGRPQRIYIRGGIQGILMDQVKDPWVIFRGDLGDIEGFFVRIL